MSFKKNQKRYNKQVMQTGLQANKYLQNALKLINQYTTNYADRTDFWTSKLNDRQLDLLSDKYLAQNASMLRGSAAFGSNSETNRQIENNAYTQQNYLANVANSNVQIANQLQSNELSALGSAANTYNTPITLGASAAQNVDAANGSWFNALGKGTQAAGSVLQAIPTPWTQAIGAALNATGGIMTSLTSESTSLTPDQSSSISGSVQNARKGIQDWQQFGALGSNNLSTKSGSGVTSSLSNIDLSSPQSLGTVTMPTFKGFGNY